MTRMRSGICVAGLTLEPDPVTGLRWVRPVRDFDTVQWGDMCDQDGCLFACGDVVELRLTEPRPEPPHVEDWLTDFVYHRPYRLRRLEGEKRARFFPRYLDRAPQDVLVHCTRSLCLVAPQHVWVRFSLDARATPGGTGKYQARMGFELTKEGSPLNSPDILWRTEQRGIPVTDLKWQALGRAWLGEQGGHLTLQDIDLHARLNAQALYLTIGLSRAWKGKCWPLVVGVHVIPDYRVPTEQPLS
jgi:hypothetical protein